MLLDEGRVYAYPFPFPSPTQHPSLLFPNPRTLRILPQPKSCKEAAYALLACMQQQPCMKSGVALKECLKGEDVDACMVCVCGAKRRWGEVLKHWWRGSPFILFLVLSVP